MKPFLILQLRPEVEAADDEYRALLTKGGLSEGETRRIRLDVEDIPADLRLDDYSGVIVGGGPGCVSDPLEKKSPVEARIEAAVMGLLPEITARDLPFMGCCYGIGVLAHHLGGRVGSERYSEPVGPSRCYQTAEAASDLLTAGLPDEFDAFVGHKEALQELPPGAVHLLRSEACPYQMIRHGRNVYATQFHPEADGEVFELRIRIYRNRGYFPPEEADQLVAICRASDVHQPERILRRFVERYRA
ncbi:MAG: glutamine amidotransferase [Sulfuritalea sp.]|nr:glutamine amidotransferase [Sulfuritalea sp.]